jgi:hypothetical protein
MREARAARLRVPEETVAEIRVRTRADYDRACSRLADLAVKRNLGATAVRIAPPAAAA